MALDLTDGRTDCPHGAHRVRARRDSPALVDSLVEPLLQALVRRLEGVKVGDPAVEGVRMGPLAAKAQVGEVRKSVDAIAARLVRPAVSLAGLTTLIAGVYVFVVVGLGRPPTHGQRTLLALSLAAAGICALLFGPTRRRLDTLADRLVHGEQETPDAVVRAFGSQLSRAIPLAELLLQLVEILRQVSGSGCRSLDAQERRTRAGRRIRSAASSFRVGGLERVGSRAFAGRRRRSDRDLVARLARRSSRSRRSGRTGRSRWRAIRADRRPSSARSHSSTMTSMLHSPTWRARSASSS